MTGEIRTWLCEDFHYLFEERFKKIMPERPVSLLHILSVNFFSFKEITQFTVFNPISKFLPPGSILFSPNLMFDNFVDFETLFQEVWWDLEFIIEIFLNIKVFKDNKNPSFKPFLHKKNPLFCIRNLLFCKCLTWLLPSFFIFSNSNI